VPVQVAKFPACPQAGLLVNPCVGPVHPMPMSRRFATVPHRMLVGYIWLGLQLHMPPPVPLLALPLVAEPLLALPLVAVVLLLAALLTLVRFADE
jgi:hypothetical protein